MYVQYLANKQANGRMVYYYMPWSDTLRAPQHNSNTCSTFFAFQYLDIRVKYGI